VNASEGTRRGVVGETGRPKQKLRARYVGNITHPARGFNKLGVQVKKELSRFEGAEIWELRGKSDEWFYRKRLS